MEFKIKTCFYENEPSGLFETINLIDLKNLGFNTNIINGSIHKLLEFLSGNKVDIIVLKIDNIDEDRFSYIVDIIYNNFCKHIVLITDNNYKMFNNVSFLNLQNGDNFDLKLEMFLMNIKREIQSRPSKNIELLRTKVYNILDSFQFSSRHDGFKYYMDAIIIAYMKKPYDYSTMQVYKEIAEMHNKTSFAVEKSMRTALSYAFNKLKSVPETPKNTNLKSHLTYDLNNNTAISMLLSMLMMDNDLREDNFKEVIINQ